MKKPASDKNMMTLREYVDFFNKVVETSNTVFRQLAFAAFAIVWLFKHEDKNTSALSIPLDFKTPIYFFILSLTCDLLQYFISALANGLHAVILNMIQKKAADYKFKLHIAWLAPNWIFYMAKMVLLIMGYIYLFSSLVHYFK